MGSPRQTKDQYLDLVTPPLLHVPWPQRALATQRELNVEMSPRYTQDQRIEGGKPLPSPGATWCNVYVTDFIRLMGLEAPTHWVTSAGAPAVVGKGVELSANRMVDWFHTHGARYGWMVADSSTAAASAGRGHLVAVGWKSPSPKSGHVAILLGPDRITQAGRVNHFVCTVRMGFGVPSDDKGLKWFIQMERPGNAELPKHKGKT